MSPLTFIVPWVLLSLVVTPLIGGIIARTLGIEGDLDRDDDSIDSELATDSLATDEDEVENRAASILGVSGDGVDIG
jgi:hypothetical protein